MPDFHSLLKGLDQAALDQFHIAVGWGELTDTFSIGCEICDIYCAGKVNEGHISRYGENAANRVENEVWIRFIDMAERLHCIHLKPYQTWKSNGN